MSASDGNADIAKASAFRIYEYTPQSAGLCDLLDRLGLLILAVSSLISDFPKNISVPTHPKSLLELFASHPTRGAYRDRHGRGVRMRWTRQRQARNVMQGGLAKGP
jgi:hypothetical protein